MNCLESSAGTDTGGNVMGKTDKALDLLAKAEKSAAKTRQAEEAKRATRVLFNKFCYLYKEKTKWTYVPASKPGDLKMIKTLHEAFGLNLTIQIMEQFFKEFNQRFRTEKYVSPRIGGLRLFAPDLAVEIREREQVEAPAKEDTVSTGGLWL
jgi:hypothetical protein